jgi:hypothetical protein
VADAEGGQRRDRCHQPRCCRATGETGSPLFREYLAICNWLGESGEIADFMDMANDYRARIGVDRAPADGEAYLRALIDLAKLMFGAG